MKITNVTGSAMPSFKEEDGKDKSFIDRRGLACVKRSKLDDR